MACPCRGDGMEGKDVRMTLSGTDQKDQVWKQTLEKSKDDFGVSGDFQTAETQTQALPSESQ